MVGKFMERGFMFSRFLPITLIGVTALAGCTFEPTPMFTIPPEPTRVTATFSSGSPTYTPRPKLTQEQKRVREIDRKVKEATLHDLTVDLDPKLLWLAREKIARQHPNASTRQLHNALEAYLKDRWRLTLEFLDACEHGANPLTGAPDLSDGLPQLAVQFEQEYGYPCRFLSERGVN